MFAAHGSDANGANGSADGTAPRPEGEAPGTGFEEVVLEDPGEALKRAREEAADASRDAEGVTRDVSGDTRGPQG
jgi:hypothetical protein